MTIGCVIPVAHHYVYWVTHQVVPKLRGFRANVKAIAALNLEFGNKLMGYPVLLLSLLRTNDEGRISSRHVTSSTLTFCLLPERTRAQTTTTARAVEKNIGRLLSKMN